MDIQAASPCCDFEDETMGHILFRCSKEMAVWSIVGLHLHIAQVENPTQTLLELFQCIIGGDVWPIWPFVFGWPGTT